MWAEMYRFETARFVILGEIAPDDMPWDGEGEAPDCDPFIARVRVAPRDDESETLGEDVLGGCYYDRPEDFFRVESYATHERDTMREIRRTMAHVRYLQTRGRMFRGQVARELARVAELRRDLSAMRARSRAGVVMCGYFADMVREAISAARGRLRDRRILAETMRA